MQCFPPMYSFGFIFCLFPLEHEGCFFKEFLWNCLEEKDLRPTGQETFEVINSWKRSDLWYSSFFSHICLLMFHNVGFSVVFLEQLMPYGSIIWLFLSNMKCFWLAEVNSRKTTFTYHSWIGSLWVKFRFFNYGE